MVGNCEAFGKEMKDFVLPWLVKDGEILEDWHAFTVRYLPLNQQSHIKVIIPAWFTSAIEAYVKEKTKDLTTNTKGNKV